MHVAGVLVDELGEADVVGAQFTLSVQHGHLRRVQERNLLGHLSSVAQHTIPINYFHLECAIHTKLYRKNSDIKGDLAGHVSAGTSLWSDFHQNKLGSF